MFGEVFLDWNLQKSEYNIIETMMLLSNKIVERVESLDEFVVIYFKETKFENVL